MAKSGQLLPPCLTSAAFAKALEIKEDKSSLHGMGETCIEKYPKTGSNEYNPILLTNNFVTHKVVSHLNQILTINPIRHEVITGKDGKKALKIIFNSKNDGDLFVDHLIQNPYNIGSATYGTVVKKLVQKENDTQWSVYVREDQLQEYYSKAILPILISKQHILTISLMHHHSEAMIGNDQKPALKILFDKEDEAQNVVDHLFQSPYNIGSTTNGTNVKKTVQKVNDTQWAIFIREDQLQDYYKKLLTHIIIIDLNRFLEMLSLKEHIYRVMAEQYSDRHAKGAIIECNVINQDQKQLLRIAIRHDEQYAKDFFDYLKSYILILNIKSIQTNQDFFYIDLSPQEFFSYANQIQINGIYHHHTLDTLFKKLVQKCQFTDNETEQQRYDKLLTIAMDKLLGKYCYADSEQNFNPQHITMKVIDAYIQHNLKLTKPEHSCVDIENILENKIENLMQKNRLSS